MNSTKIMYHTITGSINRYTANTLGMFLTKVSETRKLMTSECQFAFYSDCSGSALKKAGGAAFEEEVKNLAKDKGPLEVADG